MNRRRIAIGVSSVSGLAVIAVGAMTMVSTGAHGRPVDLHATPVAAVGAAGTATGQAGSAQVDTMLTMSTPAIPARGKSPAVPAKTATMHGTGSFDFAKGTGGIDLSVPNVPNSGAQEVMTPSALYVRATAASPSAATSAKGWQEVELAKSPDGSLVTGGAIDPELVFAMLAGIQPGTKYVGPDEVRGVPVAHYQGTLDLQQAANAAALPGVQPAHVAVAKQALGNAARALSPKVPFDVYLDAQGRMRRFVGQFTYSAGGSPQTVVNVTSATELFGFGTPVDVTVPSVAQTPARPAKSAPSGGATGPTHPSSPTGTHK